MSTRSLVVELSIEADEFLQSYRGATKDVLARAVNGQTIRFPANILKSFVSHDGIQGRFRIHFDQKGKFVSIDRLA